MASQASGGPIQTQIIWDTHDGLLIRDIHEKSMDHVKQFMLENYFRPHHLFDVLGFHEIEPDIDETYLRYLTHILNDDCSIMVVDEETGKNIYAVAMVKWMTKEWYSWPAIRLICPTGKFYELITMRISLIDKYAQENPNHPYDCLHLFEYYISDELKYDDIFKEKFFNAICEVARHMHMPRVTYLGLSMADQEEVETEGFVEIATAIYSQYTHFKTRKRPFEALRDIYEMYGKMYEKMVKPLVPYYEFTVSSGIPVEEVESVYW